MSAAELPSTVRGPDVAVIGWIPELRDLPAAYETLDWNHRFAMWSLFRFSGNPEPAVTSLQDLAALEASREFRLALTIWNVEAVWNDSDEPKFIWNRRATVGFTPYPRPGLARRGYFQGNANEVSDDVSTTDDCIQVSVNFEVRISALADWGQAAATWHRAASASVSLKYSIYRDKRIVIDTSSTCIPSQMHLAGWGEFARNDMTLGPADDVRAFITTGRGPAPVCRNYTCRK